MYKKIEKTTKNPYGIKKVKIDSIERPIVLFSATGDKVMDINGYLNRLIYLLRLRKGENVNIGLDVSEVPFDLYGSSSLDLEADVLIDAIKGVDNKDIEKAKRLFRNINFVSYCSGNDYLLPVIESIHDQLVRNGFSGKDIEEVMSQISVLQVVDNLGLDGDTFPYVTTNTIHIKQDDNNCNWLEEDIENKEGQFSKAFVKKVNKNKEIIIFDSFGESGLECGYEHQFDKHYLLFPVVNALMSICLVESLRSSLKGIGINLDYYQDGLNYILTKAHEYEIKLGKDLDALTNEELNTFSEYMMNIMTDYVREMFNINDIDYKKIEKKVRRENTLKEITYDLSFDYDTTIISIINDILSYKDRDMDEIDMWVIANIRIQKPVRNIISFLYEDLIDDVKKKIQRINNINFSNNNDEELDLQLVNWKKESIKAIYELLDNEELKTILRRADVDFESDMKLLA